MRPAVQGLPSLPSVVERHLPGAFERAGRGHAHECTLDRPACERRAHHIVLARREDERQRRRPLAQVGACDLAGLDRLARAVEDVVRDLEGDAEVEAETGEDAARAERAGGLEELPGLERTAFEVCLDRRVGVVALTALHRLAAGETERRIREHGHPLDIAFGGQLGERAREEIVARCPRRVGSMSGPRRLLSSAHGCAVDQVVVDERGHVDELDGDSGCHGRRLARRRTEKRKQRPQTLPAGCERVGADLGGTAAVRRDGCRETHLDLVQVRVEPGQTADILERRHRAAPMWRATMPPPSRRNVMSPKP